MAGHFQNASHFTIQQAHFTEVLPGNGAISTLQYLQQHMARGASHDSKDQDDLPKCHPETRKRLLSDIHDWITVPDKESGVLYLHGPAGAGKSCIARSACHKAASEGLLGASFFFRKGVSDRSNADKLFASIAYQLAKSDKILEEQISKELTRHPDIINMSLSDQFRRLIYKPCLTATRSKLQMRVVVMDGLDECADERVQLAILKLISEAVHLKQFPLGFFITSRPEIHIQEALMSPKIASETQTIVMGDISETSQDIRTVLQSGFTRILNNSRFRDAFKSVPRPWPSHEHIETLVRRSSFQFIYPATVLKFVASPDHSPISQLQIVLGIKDSGNSSPYADLDLLYRAIMSTARDTERTLSVLKFIIALLDQKSVFRISEHNRTIYAMRVQQAIAYNHNRILLIAEQLLGLPKGEAYLALNQLHSLLSLAVGHDSFIDYSEIYFHHKSFQDFLVTKTRSKEFFIDLEDTHADFARRCLDYLSRPKYETEEQLTCWFYSVTQWSVHFYMSNQKIDVKAYIFSLHRLYMGPTYNLNRSYLTEQFTKRYFGEHVTDSKIGVTIRCLRRHEKMRSRYIFFVMSDAWHFIIWRRKNVDYEHFRKTYTFPVYMRFFRSYQNDAVIRQLLLTTSLLPIRHDYKYRRYEHHAIGNTVKLHLQDVGLISPSESSDTLNIDTYIDILQELALARGTLAEFISNNRYSGPFYCTARDRSKAVAMVIEACESWPKSVKLNSTLIQDLAQGWMTALRHLKPSASGEIILKLESVARDYHDINELNKTLTHYSEAYLIEWLKGLEDSRPETIKAWERAFQKARHLTLGGLYQYEVYSYFCHPVLGCSYCPGYTSSNTPGTKCSVCIAAYNKRGAGH